MSPKHQNEGPLWIDFGRLESRKLGLERTTIHQQFRRSVIKKNNKPQHDHKQRHLRDCNDEGHEEQQHEEGEDGGAGWVAGAGRGHGHHGDLGVLAAQRRRRRAAQHRARRAPQQPRHALATVLVHAWGGNVVL